MGSEPPGPDSDSESEAAAAAPSPPAAFRRPGRVRPQPGLRLDSDSENLTTDSESYAGDRDRPSRKPRAGRLGPADSGSVVGHGPSPGPHSRPPPQAQAPRPGGPGGGRLFYKSATRLLMLFYNHLKLEKINQIFGIIMARPPKSRAKSFAKQKIGSASESGDSMAATWPGACRHPAGPGPSSSCSTVSQTEC